MHVLRLTYDQKHTLRTADKKVAELEVKFEAAQAALNAVSEELNEVREFRRDAAKGMCEAAFGEKSDYVVEESADGEYLAYRYDPPYTSAIPGYNPFAALQMAQSSQLGPLLGSPNWFGNIFGSR